MMGNSTEVLVPVTIPGIYAHPGTPTSKGCGGSLLAGFGPIVMRAYSSQETAG